MFSGGNPPAGPGAAKGGAPVAAFTISTPADDLISGELQPIRPVGTDSSTDAFELHGLTRDQLRRLAVKVIEAQGLTGRVNPDEVIALLHQVHSSSGPLNKLQQDVEVVSFPPWTETDMALILKAYQMTPKQTAEGIIPVTRLRRSDTGHLIWQTSSFLANTVFHTQLKGEFSFRIDGEEVRFPKCEEVLTQGGLNSLADATTKCDKLRETVSHYDEQTILEALTGPNGTGLVFDGKTISNFVLVSLIIFLILRNKGGGGGHGGGSGKSTDSRPATSWQDGWQAAQEGVPVKPLIKKTALEATAATMAAGAAAHHSLQPLSTQQMSWWTLAGQVMMHSAERTVRGLSELDAAAAKELGVYLVAGVGIALATVFGPKMLNGGGGGFGLQPTTAGGTFMIDTSAQPGGWPEA